KAVDRREFRIVYQPIVALGSGKIVGFEALLRWDSPTRGPVSPVEFIPVLEETGLIQRAGGFVLREACAQLKVWQETIPACRGLYVAVNLSCKHFARRELSSEVQSILSQTGLAGAGLKIEVTESALIEDVDAARST